MLQEISLKIVTLGKYRPVVHDLENPHAWQVLYFKNDYICMAELKNIRIAVSGIYDYAKSEIPTLRIPMPGAGAPEWVEDKNIYKVYRPASVLAAACSKFANLPLTHHHPRTPIDGQNFRDLAVGWTGERPETDFISETDEVGIRSTCVLYDDEALTAYERGEIQLSPGYIAVFEWNKGTDPHGNEYDIVMKEITDVNHLALLPAGRGGEYAVVMDKQPTVFDLVKTHDGAPKGNDNASKNHISEEENQANKKRVFGKEYVGVKGTDAINKLIKEKQGFVQNAFQRDDIGGIDVVYGEITNPKTLKGYGLKKILARHPDITPEIIADVIKNGTKEKTFNGCNLLYNGYLVGLNKGYTENGKKVTTDNWIVTSFKNEKEKVNDTKASVVTFTSDTSESDNLSLDEIVIGNSINVKSIFDIAKGSVFDRVKGGILWL